MAAGRDINNYWGRSRSRVRSAYLRQVEYIAQHELIGREQELGELARFCTEDDRGPYVWWRASAWSGKSLLMATFVLSPPDKVDVVPFFITARFGSQADRFAFTHVVLEQLAELTGQDLPPGLNKYTQEAHLRDLLAQAAQTSADQGRRLVLLVDGLDEDRGVTSGPDAHSIAALLPTRPVAGMRVIVAGRPNPPIPSDVPSRHPLRDPGIARTLARSEYAEMIRDEAERDMQRILEGTPVEQDILGLLVGAIGGLTTTDLTELIGADTVTEHEVRKVLATVSGRSFASRVSHLNPMHGPEVYILAHEDLQETAIQVIGPHRLAGYRDRLHAWAEHYRERQWPTSTPQYLLSGYFAMLQTAGETSRLVDCAVDETRHDRMLDLSGGDAAALSEITTAQSIILAQPAPDLTDMARLAIHRHDLSDRNANIPADLPVVWAILGQPVRAENLALSIADPDQRVSSLAMLVEALAGIGDRELATTLVAKAEKITQAMAAPDQQVHALIRLMEVLAGIGDRDGATVMAARAEAIAQAIASHGEESVAGLVWLTKQVAESAGLPPGISLGSVPELTLLVRGVAAGGDFDYAEAIAKTTPGSYWQVRGLIELAEAFILAGELQRALSLTGDIEVLAQSIPEPDVRELASTDIIKVRVKLVAPLILTGELRGALSLIAHNESLARTITDGVLGGLAGADLAEGQVLVFAARKDYDRAAAIAGTVDSPWQRLHIVEALVTTGELDLAAAIIVSLNEPAAMARALAALVKSLADSGKLEPATALVNWVKNLPNSWIQAQALADSVQALAKAGDLECLESLDSITHTRSRANAMAGLARTLADAGELELARTMASRSEALARAAIDVWDRVRELTSLTKALTTIGEPQLAEAQTSSISHAVGL